MERESIRLKVIEGLFSVCKVEDYTGINLDCDFVFLGSTDEEKSLVCPVSAVPSGVLERSDGWKAFRIEGILDFSLVGILAGISSCLAENGIGIFAISTFNTDYVFVREENLGKAVEVLAGEGYVFVQV